MTLVYRSVFTDSDGRIAASTEKLFLAWLETKGMSPSKGALGEVGVPLQSDTGAMAWAQRRIADLGVEGVLKQLRLVEESDEARWVTTISWKRSDTKPAGTGGASDPSGRSLGGSSAPIKWVWIDLEHEPYRGRKVMRPGSPRIVRELMAAGEAYDGKLPVTADAWTVTAAHVPELESHIRSSDRRIPIVVFAHDAQRAYDQRRLARDLARDLAGVAAVFVLGDRIATDRLSESLPEGYGVFGGALRTYLPGAASEDDHSSRHRILGRTSLVALGARAFPAVKDQILDLSTRQPAPMDPGSLRRLLAGTRRALPVSDRPSTTETSTAVVPWLTAHVRRIKGFLGSPVKKPIPTGLGEAQTMFDETLEELLRLPLERAPEQGLTTSMHTELAGLAAELETSDQDRVLLEQLLEESHSETTEAQENLARSRDDRDFYQLEAIESEEIADKAQRRIRWLERRIHELGDPGVGTDDALPGAPDSVAEVVALARQHLPFVLLGDIDASSAELDLHPGAQLYALKTWAALTALNAYAAAQVDGRFAGSFFQWCQEQPAGEAAISANSVAMGESETVDSNPALREARVFQVPKNIDPTGRAYMPAHVKIVKRGSPCPRLHFHDDSSGSTGRVHIGYIGAHLPTANYR